MRPPATARLGSPWLAAVATVLLVGTWLADLTGEWLPRAAARGGAALALVLLGVWLAAWTLTALREPEPAGARRRWLLALVAVALAVRLVGIDFELTDHPRNDEGVYIEMSQRIAAGALRPGTFNYGHFLYYAGALILWVERLFPGPVDGLAGLVYGVETPFEIDSILLRALTAALAALTTAAVFVIGSRLGGLLTAVLAALLITFSPLYNDIAHQLISDVPAAFFATLTIAFVAGLLDRERLGPYVFAGIAAGLAAGSKYPGGVAAIAIVAVWIYWRIVTRRWSWGLPVAGLAAIVAMLAVMPTVIVDWRAAFSGSGLDVFFGFRQYAFGGWLGVQPESAAAWYGAQIVQSFGWPALLVGLTGVFVARPPARRRLLLLLPFPVLYLVLIAAMSMVVRRNLQPALPMIAVVLAAGIVGWVELARRRAPRWAGLLSAALAAAALAWPLVHTVAFDIARTRPGTRQLARTWIEKQVPDGASILRESYTSVLDPERYDVQFLRFAAWLAPADLLTTKWDYVLLARAAHARFLDPAALSRDHEREFARRYERMFASLELVREFEPGLLRAGAHLLLYRVTPEEVTWRTARRFAAGDATWVSDPPLLRQGAGRPLIYTRHWQYAVFKEFLAPGRYRIALEVDREPEVGYLYAVTPDNREIGTWEITSTGEIDLPGRDKVLFRVFLPPPTQLAGWSLERLGPVPPAPQ